MVLFFYLILTGVIFKTTFLGRCDCLIFLQWQNDYFDKFVNCSCVQVSATFAASLVTSPAIGAYLSASYGDNLVVLVATLVAVVDICFILLAVPESLPEKIRPASWGASISWEQADLFAVRVISN